MNQRTTEKLLEASRRIYNSLIRWSVTGIVGVMLMPFGYLNDSILIFALGVTAFVSSFIAISLNLIMIRGINRNMPDDNPPPPSAADYLDFEQVHRPAETRIEVTSGNTIRLGKYRLTQMEWAALAESLHRHGWKWTRDGSVRAAGVFANLSSRFPDITKDMTNIEFLEGEPRSLTVSQQGKLWFIEQSPRLRLEDMR
jgi:hypothetical protein